MSIPTQVVATGKQTVLDYPSNSSPVQIWQDPNILDNIHAVTMYNDAGLTGTRKSAYLFSSDRGTTWTEICNVPSVRSGFTSIDGFSDGTALITCHTADPDPNPSATLMQSMAYKDASPGLGSFTRLTPPGTNLYIWGRVMATKDLSQTIKFLMISSVNSTLYDSVFMNKCTDVSATPGTWSGWSVLSNASIAEKHPMARGADGRIGLAYINSATPEVFFMESTNNGTTFSAPTKIYTWTPTNHYYGSDIIFGDYGPLTGISIAYKGNTPVVTFDGLLQTSSGYYPLLESKIFFWSSTLPGADPNRSVVVADTNKIGFIPYVGIAYNDGQMTHPNIGTSADGNAIFISFFATSGTIDASDSTSNCAIWLFASNNGGVTWPIFSKVSPTSPVKDWRYVSISKLNDNSGTNYYANMIATRGNVAGTYTGGAPASLEDVYFLRSTVTLTNNLPSPPTLVSPLNSATGVSLTPLIDWSDVAGVTYNLQVSANSGFATTVVNLSSLTSSQYQIPSGLFQMSTTYYWRVSSTNSNGTGNWSSPWSFTTLGAPPAPTLITPTNGSSILTLTPTLDWGDVAGATTYNLQVSTNSGFTTTVVNLSSLAVSQFQIPSGILLPGTIYYWRASATNSNGTGVWSSPWNFTTPSAPAAPTLITPTNGSNILTTTPTLDWADVSGATSYSVQVSTTTGFTTTVVNVSSLTASQYQVPSGILLPSTIYYWRANASNTVGTGTWSSVWNFSAIPTGISQYSLEIPKEFKLHNNFPNPFNPTTKIRFDIPKNSNVKISIYDINGRIINQLINKDLVVGCYELNWNASNLASGVYFYRIDAESFSDIKRMLFVK